MTTTLVLLATTAFFLGYGALYFATRIPRLSACPQCHLTTTPLQSWIPRALRILERRFCARCGWEGLARPLPREAHIPPLPNVDTVLREMNELIAPPPPTSFRWGRRTALWVPRFEWKGSGPIQGADGSLSQPPPPPIFVFKNPTDGSAQGQSGAAPPVFAFRPTEPEGFQWGSPPTSEEDGAGPPRPIFEFRPPGEPGFHWGDD